MGFNRCLGPRSGVLLAKSASKHRICDALLGLEEKIIQTNNIGEHSLSDTAGTNGRAPVGFMVGTI
jgi:hypothetical protein